MNRKKELCDEIVRLAYDFYEKRGRVHGFDLEDWLKAERIVMERHAAEVAREASLVAAAAAAEKKSKENVRRSAPKAPKRPRKPVRRSATK